MHDGIKDSYAHMSLTSSDASQGTFFEIQEMLRNRYFLYYKKITARGLLWLAGQYLYNSDRWGKDVNFEGNGVSCKK